MGAPEYSAGVEAWTLGGFTNRRVWARPHDGPDTQQPEWAGLRQVWAEDLDTEGMTIVGRIDWHGQDALVRWIITNRVQVELTADEAPHIRTRRYGGYSSTYYDPWDTAELEVISYCRQLPTPAPAVPVVESEVGPQYALF